MANLFKEGFFIALGIGSFIWLLNFTFGLDIFPAFFDNLPITGNIDEVGATIVLGATINRYFGFNPITATSELMNK